MSTQHDSVHAQHLSHHPSSHPSSAKDEKKVVQSKSKGLRTLVIILLLIGGIVMLVIHIRKQNEKKEKAEGDIQPPAIWTQLVSNVRSAIGYPEPVPVSSKPHALQSQSTQMLATENSDSMLRLALGLKEAGVRLKGVSQCRFTQIQREAFGGRDSEARKVIESIYTECRSRDMCPNIRGYPTWTLNDRQWPGNRNANALRAILSEARVTNTRPMLQGPSEPQIEEIPDAQHTEQTGDQEIPPVVTAEVEARMAANEEDGAYADAVAELESSKTAKITSETAESKTTSGGTDPAKEGGASPFGNGGFLADNEVTVKPVKKENVRGVSNFPPLNTPDMPGTAPFVLWQEKHEDQTRQGNAPRASTENHQPTPSIMKQHLDTFDNEKVHVATRDPNADSYSLKKFPHSADITTGEAFADKTIYTEKN